MTGIRAGKSTVPRPRAWLSSAARSGVLGWLVVLAATSPAVPILAPLVGSRGEQVPGGFFLLAFILAAGSGLLWYVSIWKLWRGHLAPYLASGPMAPADVDRLSARIETSGEFLASDSTHGETLGGASWLGGFVEVVVHPAGLLLAPLHFRPQAILASDITSVERHASGRLDRLIITHRATAARSPVTLDLDPGSPVPDALAEVVPRRLRGSFRPDPPVPIDTRKMANPRVWVRLLRLLTGRIARPYVVWLFPIGPTAWLERSRFPRLVAAYHVLACGAGAWFLAIGIPGMALRSQTLGIEPLDPTPFTVFSIAYVASHAWALLERR